MTCLACRRWGAGILCGGCLAALAPAPDRYLPGGLVVKAAFLHAGPARALVHRLKYEGIRPAAELLAAALVERWGPPPDLLVPDTEGAPTCLAVRGGPGAGVGPSDGGDQWD